MNFINWIGGTIQTDEEIFFFWSKQVFKKHLACISWACAQLILHTKNSMCFLTKLSFVEAPFFSHP